MPIQFCCTQCGQPIEVDDQHAGQTAACPYCRHMVSVPSESTYNPEAAAAARPAGSPGTPTMGPTPSEPPPATAGDHRGALVPPPRRQAATTTGTYALICTALAVILFAIGVVGSLVIFVREGGASPTSGPTREQLEKLRPMVMSHPWIPATELGGMFFTLVGVALAIVSLVQSARGNWRALTSLIVCVVLLLCICSSAALNAMMGLGMPAPG